MRLIAVFVALVPLLGLPSGCTSTGKVEDADLFSIGNIPRWEREQQEREKEASQLKSENIALEHKLAERIAKREQLEATESALKTRLDTQRNEIAALTATIQTAFNQKHLTELQHGKLNAALDKLLRKISELSAIRDYSQREILDAENTTKKAQRLIDGLSEARRNGYKNIDDFVRTLD